MAQPRLSKNGETARGGEPGGALVPQGKGIGGAKKEYYSI